MPKTKSHPVRNVLGAEAPGYQSRRFRPGAAVLREIKRYQHSSKLLGERALFSKQVSSILDEIDPRMSFDYGAKLALQYAAEDYLVRLFRDMIPEAMAAGRQTLMPSDMQLALKAQEMHKLQRELDEARLHHTEEYVHCKALRIEPELSDWEYNSAASSSSEESSEFSCESDISELDSSSLSDSFDMPYVPVHRMGE